MTPHQAIAQIDILLDANRDATIRRLGFNPRTAREWQACWDRLPMYRARRDELYRQRGLLQIDRDAADHREWKSAERKRLAAERRTYKQARRQCPTCGQLAA